MITNITTAKWFFPAFDAGLMLVFSSAVTLYCINRISKKFPDTNELLPFFGLIVWVLLIVGYYVVRYNNNYQTSLSIIVAGSIAGMGWWIQFITSAASDRRKHTLNVVLSTRTCTEYQTNLRNFTHLWRGNRHIPKELCEWRDDPDNPKFQNANVPKEVVDGINGMLYILNFFEFLAQGIKANDLDDKLLRECFCGFLEGLERRAYFILSEAQKKDERFFEGIVFLCKRWNNDKSIIEKHRHSAPPVDIGISYPPKDEVMEMLGMTSHDHQSRKRRRRKTKKVTTTQPAANTSPLNSSQIASSG
ncbi:hypothetical protein AE49_04693 [Escherichia coli BIDMC 74]|nr:MULTISPECIES: DUF4760 domain-containing protein [Enterobacteriaceae]EFH9191622.1 DUF4760 domain-containing protein [Escherichia coli]EFK5194026.1 DUF4760 domain-containing protein [Escherichia coli]EFM6491952.1 DUF4760 domain-containing protein [Escherichia coli]EFM6539475.1 DUF4760 domain-containing protein [Escherichia coli]EFM6564715.1 DUF4760 domain-containing protein [Escherichia coli]